MHSNFSASHSPRHAITSFCALCASTRTRSQPCRTFLPTLRYRHMCRSHGTTLPHRRLRAPPPALRTVAHHHQLSLGTMTAGCRARGRNRHSSMDDSIIHPRHRAAARLFVAQSLCPIVCQSWFTSPPRMTSYCTSERSALLHVPFPSRTAAPITTTTRRRSRTRMTILLLTLAGSPSTSRAVDFLVQRDLPADP